VRHAGRLHQRAVGQLAQRRQRVVGAVDHQLGPQRAAHIGRYLHGNARIAKLQGHLFAECRGRDGQLAAAEMAHMAGAGHGRGHVDHGGSHGHGRAQHGAHALVVVHAVLHGQHQSARRQVRLHLAGRFLGGRGLDAEHHHIGIAHGAGLGRCLHGHLNVQCRRLQPQAMLLHGLHMGGTANQRDLVAGAGQQCAEIAAHGACAHDGDAQRRGGGGGAGGRSVHGANRIGL